MALSKKEKKRVEELSEEIHLLEQTGKRGFCTELIPLYKEMQALYRKQEATKKPSEKILPLLTSPARLRIVTGPGRLPEVPQGNGKEISGE